MINEEFSLKPIHQHPSDLSLALFSGEPAHPMTTLKRARVGLGPWEATFHIIGESHAAVLARDGVPVFSEMLSCAPIDAAQCERLFSLADLSPIHHEQPGYAVQVSVQPPVIPARAEHITYHFPPVFGQQPLTRVQWHHIPGGLQWWTLHTYPLQDEVISIYTMSQFHQEDL